MKNAILFLCLFFNLHSFAQTVKLKVHIVRNEIGDMGLSVADAEAMITKIGEDFDGTTAANMIGGSASTFDTGIRFCPEIVIYEDDDLIHQYNHTLAANNSTPGYVNLFLNFYGDHTGSGMIAGRDLSVNNSVWVSNYRSVNHTATHEIGHSFTLGHCTTWSGNTLVGPNCFAQFMASSTSPWSPPSGNPVYTAPYHFTTAQSNQMGNYLQNNTGLLVTNCLEFPTADFDVNIKGPAIGSQISFTDLSSSNAVSWSWDFGDFTPLDPNQNPTHTYTSS